MWRHLSVASARVSLVVATVGTYLNMSLSGCPDVANIVRMGVVPEDAKAVESTLPSPPRASEDRRMYVGFVSQEKDANEDALPNMARGSAC